MCRRSLLPSSVSPGSELRVREQLFIREPPGDPQLQEGERGIIRPPPPPSVPAWGPARARGSSGSLLWQPCPAAGWLGRWRCVPSLGDTPPAGCGQALGVQGGPPAAASPSPCTPIPPSSFSRVPLVPTHQEMGGKLGEGGARAPLPGGQGTGFPRTPGQPRTPLCSRVAGCLSIAKELLLKSSNSKGIRPVWGKE